MFSSRTAARRGGVPRFRFRRTGLRGNGRRPARGPDGEQESVGDNLQRQRAAGVGQIRGADKEGRVRVGADDARCAGRAVRRRFQMAEEIVMLERRRHQEQRINRHAQDRVNLRAPTALP